MDLKILVIIFFMMGVINCTKDLINGSEVYDTSISIKKYSTFVDLMIDEISNQKWKENELQCQEQILSILINVKNSTLWATWIWNSIPVPTGQFFGARVHIGNFDQCLRRLWKDDPVPTQYCFANIELTTTENRDLTSVNPYDTAENYLRIRTEYDFTFNEMSWGVCVPAVCKKESVKRFVNTLFKLSHMGTINDQPIIEIQDCQRTYIPPANTTGLNLLILTAVFFIIVTCICTYISTQKSFKHHPILMKIIDGFDLRSNVSNLFTVNENDIKVMNGMRALSSFTVIGLHATFTQLLTSPANGLDQNKDFEFYSNFLSHTDVLVDTFFMMSGLLLMKSFKPETGRIISPFKVVIKRYFRFIWVLAIMIAIMITASPYLLGGPIWIKYGKSEQDSCQKYWWLNLLMLNNYIDKKDMCIQVSWYIPADYHMAVATVFLYWFYQKNRRVGLLLFSVAAMASFLLPGIYTYQNKLEAVPSFRFRSLANTRGNILDEPAYVYSHLRAGAYFVGLAAGYILCVYKPANYRNVISKTNSVLGFLIIIALGISILFLGPVFLFTKYNALKSALFVTINRPLWAVLSAAIIMICEYGSLPILTKFLSWKLFVMLSKVSYGMYLCHYIFLLRLIVPLRTQTWHDALKVNQDSLGLFVITVLASLYIALFIEIPLNNILDLVINMKAQRQNQVNGTATKSADGVSNAKAKNKLEICLDDKNYSANERKDSCKIGEITKSNNNGYSSEDTKKDI